MFYPSKIPIFILNYIYLHFIILNLLQLSWGKNFINYQFWNELQAMVFLKCLKTSEQKPTVKLWQWQWTWWIWKENLPGHVDDKTFEVKRPGDCDDHQLTLCLSEILHYPYPLLASCGFLVGGRLFLQCRGL